VRIDPFQTATAFTAGKTSGKQKEKSRRRRSLMKGNHNMRDPNGFIAHEKRHIETYPDMTGIDWQVGSPALHFQPLVRTI
jgi:hypothetical protein